MIPVEVIDDVRRSHELVAFMESAGVKLRRQGSSLMGLCPFHSDRTPSLAVQPDKQYWCCHGACSAGGKTVGGDVIEFARRIWGMTFPEALKRLAGGAASAPVSLGRPLHLVARSRTRGQGAARAAAPALLERVMACYRQGFLSSVPAQEYLTMRGITSPELLAALPVGYADGALLELAPEGSDTHAALLAAGVLCAPGRELLSGCVVFPLRDLEGRIVGLYGRGIKGNGDDRHCYLPGPRRGLVNAACAATADELVIAESVIDALSFLQAGIPNAVPIYGTNGWTPDHHALIEKHRVVRVVLALDADDAGQKATAAIGEKLRARGLDVVSVVLPAKDPNDLLVREGPNGFAAAWRKLVAPRSEAAKEEATTPSVTPGLSCEDGAHVLPLGARTYRIRGLQPSGVDRLRVNVRAEAGERFHVDTFDLYSARSRKSFVEACVEAFGTTEAEIAKELAAVIGALEKERLRLRAQPKGDAAPKAMSHAERKEAMAFLTAPDLLKRLRDDLAAVGCVGEDTAMLIGYLAALSRKLSDPLAVLFCARSGAGKSNLQERIIAFVPPEDLISYTRITGQALFYKDENALVHKVLAIDEEEGAADATYALRSLQSSGALTVSATRADPVTGKHVADDYKVKGPTAIFLTTAHPEALDYETRNRFVIVTINESKEQTKAILAWQRWSETLEGLVAQEKKAAVLRRHHNAQRLLLPLRVVIPMAPSLGYPEGMLILRREQKKYLALIKAIALLHQHQRPRKTMRVEGKAIEYIEATAADVELAASLAAGVLRRNLDELAPPTRTLLTEIQRLVAAKQKAGQRGARVDRHEIQKATGLSYWHVRVYLTQLVEYGYLEPVTGSAGKRVVYELAWSGDDESEDPTAALAPKARSS